MTEPDRPYAGLFVLDAGQGVAGPCCGMMLAATGADVVKLEPPEGDWSRGLSVRQGSESVLHATWNRGKRGIVLDLKDPAGRAAAKALAARADVLIESFRPGVAARLGLGPEDTGPDAVCLSISGFGQTGPYAERPCTDSVAQAFGGLAALNTGADGIPHKTGPFVTDVFTGVAAFSAVQAALAARLQDRAAGRPPRRRVLDLSLLGGTAMLLASQIGESALLGHPPGVPNVPAGCYQGSDGHWLMVTLVRDPEFVTLCEVLGLAMQPRFDTFAKRSEQAAVLVPLVRAAFATRGRDEWLAALQAARLMSCPVNSPNDWLADPHVVAVGAAPASLQGALGAVPFPVLPGLPASLGPAPRLGEHTAEVLSQAP
ncbi:CaiB/BaiF CoA transferase family protein [Humitalea sp. 24SJ18S-53]|uniref:CaiB/BaiF CoA transferase family protein n=1 Tax=Humitalea sp. 24SJ18S-53 TaxID=3422307 RepID=UPI003D664DC7